MKNPRALNTLKLMLLMILSLTFISVAQAQSTDIDEPTALTSNIIEGENDGKAETFYYSFIVTKGDLKITFDGKTDEFTSWVEVTLLDEDGGTELLKFSTSGNAAGNRRVETKRFLREQKVVLRVSVEKSNVVKLLNYKIKLIGAVKLVTPDTPSGEDTPADHSEPAPPTEQTESPDSQPATETSPSTEETPSPDAQPASGSTTTPKVTPKTIIKDKDKVKLKAKKEVKKLLGGILDN